MPPNAIEISTYPDSESHPASKAENGTAVVPVPTVSTENHKLQIFQSSLYLLAHILIGIVVGISLMFAFRNGLPLGATPLHVVLCVIGYQLLMAEAIISLSSDNGWSSKLRVVDKRRAHWVLQILGAGLALAGSIIKILDKDVHWNTLHGQFALVAMVFTTVSLVNGLSSLYAYEFRKFLNGNLSKITHICFGIVGFGASTISLCYGFEKNQFMNWATAEMAYTLMAFTAAFTFIIIINPFISFYRKTVNTLKK